MDLVSRKCDWLAEINKGDHYFNFREIGGEYFLEMDNIASTSNLNNNEEDALETNRALDFLTTTPSILWILLDFIINSGEFAYVC